MTWLAKGVGINILIGILSEEGVGGQTLHAKTLKNPIPNLVDMCELHFTYHYQIFISDKGESREGGGRS